MEWAGKRDAREKRYGRQISFDDETPRSLDFSISHVRRENNTEANSLAGSAARQGLCSDQSYLALTH
jgi:hypothetical protein